MSSFSEDDKWIEAKRTVGIENSWLEIINFYRSIGGTNVFVYAAGGGDKRLIVDILSEEDDRVLLISKSGEAVIDSYENVNNSKKIFKYSEDVEHRDYIIEDELYHVVVESR